MKKFSELSVIEINKVFMNFMKIAEDNLPPGLGLLLVVVDENNKPVTCSNLGDDGIRELCKRISEASPDKIVKPNQIG